MSAVRAWVLRLSARAGERRALLVLFGLYWLMVLVVLPRASVSAIPSLDLRFWYTPDDVQAAFGATDTAGRWAFVVGHFTADLVYPLVYALLLGGLLSALTARTGRHANAPLLAWSGALFDVLENLTLSILALAYPNPLGGLAWLAALCTAAKWSAIALTFALLAWEFFAWLRVRGR